ncbi:hemin uptake protein HemP [Undibacterium oligocarboniphilum]|uniref:Hemin uptake protein HemP n=2 Tax=Undibacterium oligocarboniphilum TaxID=666702 RepID=A0A850QNS7_9BURK|nr:hemin uptake protein HemP [Undibacterium oligocarboniphilum]NVO77716.1 hemin uptake protein HemP [Undibacterium oligocarboniphilum]
MPDKCQPAADHAIAGGPACGRITSAELPGHRRELKIVHDGRVYRLRLTLNGKLILTN